MKTITGIVAFVNENEKSDNIVLEDKTRITLTKGVARNFFGAKGKPITLKVTEREWNGKTLYRAEEKDIQVEGLDVPTASAGGRTYAKKSGGYGQNNDARQESIVFQNSMAHATAIMIHNSQGEEVNVNDVLALAGKIAKVSLAPKVSAAASESVETQAAVERGTNSNSPDVF